MATSEYDPIWNQLKRDGTCAITANRLLHARILKAVMKRKWLDLGYKIVNEPYHVILTHSSKGSILTFYLTKHLNGANLTVKDI